MSSVGTPRKFQVNRGGELDPREVVGREGDIKRLLRALETQSVRLEAERRIGKTTLCKQIVHSPPPGLLALYDDAAKVGSTEGLAKALLDLIRPHLSSKGRTKNWFSRANRAAAGTGLKIGPAELKLPSVGEKPPKEILEEAFADLTKTQTTRRENPYTRVCLMLDEFPVAVEKIRAAEGDRAAMDLLDFLRYLRSVHGQALRFVFTGSIGMHHVLGALDEQKNPNRPMNDVLALHVRALEPEDAHLLARGLLLGEAIASNDYEAAAARIADLTARVPFDIHHLVARLIDEGGEANPDIIDRAMRDCLHDAQDPWQLRDYETRVKRYFGENTALALVLLDAIASSAVPLSIEALTQRVRLSPTIGGTADTTNEAAVRGTLLLLEQDFYLYRGEDSAANTYRFLRPLLARAWQRVRFLPIPSEKAS